MPTEKTAEQLLVSTDRQQLFDHTVEKLALQGRHCRDETGSNCLLWSDDGRRCAFGWMMKDPQHDLGDRLPRNAGAKQVLGVLGVRTTHEPLSHYITQVQNAHDDAKTRAALVQKLTYVAQSYDLSTATLDEHMSPAWQAAGEWRV